VNEVANLSFNKKKLSWCGWCCATLCRCLANI